MAVPLTELNEVEYYHDTQSTSYEYGLYEDTGCEVSESCLDCTLPICKHDDIFWFKHYKRLARYADIINALDKGTDTVENLAKKNNITTRTVFRLKRQFVDGEIDLQTLNDFSIIFNK